MIINRCGHYKQLQCSNCCVYVINLMNYLLMENIFSLTLLLYCPCLMFPFIVVIVCGFFFWVDVNLCQHCLLVSALSLEIQLSEGGGKDPINRFNPPTFLWLPGPGFPMLNVVVFLVFKCLRWEVVTCFIDIRRIVYHLFKPYFYIYTYLHHWAQTIFTMVQH